MIKWHKKFDMYMTRKKKLYKYMYLYLNIYIDKKILITI